MIEKLNKGEFSSYLHNALMKSKIDPEKTFVFMDVKGDLATFAEDVLAHLGSFIEDGPESISLVEVIGKGSRDLFGSTDGRLKPGFQKEVGKLGGLNAEEYKDMHTSTNEEHTPGMEWSEKQIANIIKDLAKREGAELGEDELDRLTGIASEKQSQNGLDIDDIKKIMQEEMTTNEGKKTINKEFKSLKAAENYLQTLYDKYDSAKCVSQPFSGESGVYVFEVSESVSLEEKHDKKSEEIWKDIVGEFGFKEMKEKALEAFKDKPNLQHVKDAENEKDLWDALDSMDLLDIFVTFFHTEKHNFMKESAKAKEHVGGIDVHNAKKGTNSTAKTHAEGVVKTSTKRRIMDFGSFRKKRKDTENETKTEKGEHELVKASMSGAKQGPKGTATLAEAENELGLEEPKKKDEQIKLEGQRSKIEWTPYLATAYAEGFGEGEDATAEEQVEAYACLVKTGMAWTLQGFFGRNAQNLIDRKILSKKGEIDWEKFDEMMDEMQ
jgi:hypothetical protein